MPEKVLQRNRKIKEQAKLFAALADPTRLKLFQILCNQDPRGCHCVNKLSHLLGITQPAVSQHLRVLKNAGLVIDQRRGFRTHYQIDPEGIKSCQASLLRALGFDKQLPFTKTLSS